jgi:hypothetical protein
MQGKLKKDIAPFVPAYRDKYIGFMLNATEQAQLNYHAKKQKVKVSKFIRAVLAMYYQAAEEKGAANETQ